MIGIDQMVYAQDVFFFLKPFFLLLLHDAIGDIRSIRGLLEPNEGVIRPSPQPRSKHNFRNTVIMQSAVNCSILKQRHKQR